MVRSRHCTLSPGLRGFLMRAFVAIELPEGTRKAVAGLQARLKASGAAASWVRPENFHLTLRFLGQIAPEQLLVLADRLGHDYAQCAPLRLCFQGAGAFPNPRRPAVLWAGMRAVEGELVRVWQIAEQAAQALGLPPETRDFHPHVTVGRMRDPRKTGTLGEALCLCAGLGADEFPVEAGALFESRLSAGGAIYRRLHRFMLRQA